MFMPGMLELLALLDPLALEAPEVVTVLFAAAQPATSAPVRSSTPARRADRVTLDISCLLAQ
jgi:hypothetical protein